MAGPGWTTGKKYRGDDRRVLPGIGAFQCRWLVVTVTSSGLASLLLASSLLAVTPGFAASLWRLSLAVWCSVTLASGLVLVGAWRAGGRARPGHLGPALIVAALLISLVPLALPLQGHSEDLTDRSWAMAAILAVSGERVVRAIRAREVETDLRPARQLLVPVVVATVIAVATVSMTHRGVAHPEYPNTLPVLVCFAVAIGVLAFGRGRPPAVVRSIAAAMMMLGSGLSDRIEPDSVVVGVAASAAMVVSAALLATLAAQSLRFALAGQDLRSARTMSVLADFRTAANRERERRHDALSALAAIRSANEILTSATADVRADIRDDLALAVREELSRVERMLAPEASSGPVDFDLRKTLDPVVLAWQHQGMRIRGLSQSVLVRAVPDAVTRIVNNLLHNAHQHAPGARVQLVADETETAVLLSVLDSGPGVPRQRRAEVFQPGSSWHATGEGQGLGLASARRLADEIGGELRLLDFDDGCWFVLSLPCARSTAAAPRRDADA